MFREVRSYADSNTGPIDFTVHNVFLDGSSLTLEESCVFCFCFFFLKLTKALKSHPRINAKEKKLHEKSIGLCASVQVQGPQGVSTTAPVHPPCHDAVIDMMQACKFFST